MAGSGGSDLRAPIFNGDNYEFWKIRMGTIFKSHGIWDLVEKGLEIPESKGKKVDAEGSSESEKVSLLRHWVLSKELSRMTFSPESRMRKPQRVLGTFYTKNFMAISM
ncbi:unnamed protein product [Prunus armeniaca]